MSRSLLRRTGVVFLLIVTLSASWAAAAGPQAPALSQAPAALHLLSRAWSLLTSLWGEEGCTGDPNGRCLTPKADTGCNGDPDGRCVTPKVDTGCGVDPDGRCTP